MSYNDEYYCPNCGAILNDQQGFDPDKGTWTCTKCAQRLMDDDVYYGDTFQGIEWRCDCCKALLNRQFGFSDSFGMWTCTECGYVNGTTEDDIVDDGAPIKYSEFETSSNDSFDNENDVDWAFAKYHTNIEESSFEKKPTQPSYSMFEQTNSKTNFKRETIFSPRNKFKKSTKKPNNWQFFFLCLFLGIFGIHKFAERKIGIGVLYIFTAGLFYIGWFIDILKYFKKAINE